MARSRRARARRREIMVVGSVLALGAVAAYTLVVTRKRTSGAAAAAAAYVANWRAQPATTSSSGASVPVSGGTGSFPLLWTTITPNARQMNNARIIVHGFLRAGYSPAVAAAAVANAWWESGSAHPVDGARGLNERAIGDGGMSVGVYQMSSGGAGRGMTVEARMDVANATHEMIAREMVTPAARHLLAADAAGASLDELIYLFGRDIERPLAFIPSRSTPAKHAEERAKRADMARRLWGSAAMATSSKRISLPWV